MNDIHYNATGLGEIDCDCCGNVLGFGFVDYADDCGFLCSACKIKIEHQEIPRLELERLEKICRNLDYMFCPGHKWDDISYCVLAMGCSTFECKKCGAIKQEYHRFNFEFTVNKTAIKTPITGLKYEPWTKD